MASRIGGETIEDALSSLSVMNGDVAPIPKSEYELRLEKLCAAMKSEGVDFVYLHAGTNLYYFIGFRWSPSERMVAAVVSSDGKIDYIAPQFELDTVRDFWLMPSDIHAWEEHESPYELAAKIFARKEGASVLLDEVTPFFIFDGLRKACPGMKFGHAQPLTQSIRSIKTSMEIQTIKRAHEMTLRVHQAAASILRPGISTTEVTRFIDEAHQAVGAAGSSFCIVLFGVATSFPHGVKDPQILQENDWVLIDTGCLLNSYHSDITRTFPFGQPNDEQRAAWNAEKAAQLAAFDAAKLGAPCEVVDQAARDSLQASGFGPDYQLPGLPHRTGHGCGLDIHEGPNLVRGETTPMTEGQVFSNEPMLVIPGQFGVRLEDHFYMDDSGPVWLTQPSHSIDDPFAM